VEAQVERGVYFDAWFPRQHCYHPSLPPRRLRMIDDLVDYRATTLVWAALGGGSISLPFLEQEAFGAVDARSRIYGFVNDSEFIAACRGRGIQVFGIVFEAQGWEMPVELSEDEDEVLAMNELRGGGRRGWMGLSEFSQNRYPRLWKPVEHYFPEGLRNSAGEPVTDLIAECASRDIHGEPCHAHWVECPDREHRCFMMDRNNPVWREYLKAVIRIQIDAGVDGVQLDEAEVPITSMQYGGCFCRDCMDGFRRHLQRLAPDDLPAELAGVDLESFHYGAFLLERGHDFKHGREQSPLFFDYLRFQRAEIVSHFTELAGYVREYGRSVGREVRVSGNFFNMLDQYHPLEPVVDLLITEMRNTAYRQPAWYRYVAGFAAGKPVIVVENPYGGVVPDLVEQLARGRGHDLFRLSLYEAAALGVNMSVPYGSWMGSVVEDSFWAPHDVAREIQAFLAEHERLFSTETWSEVGLVYSVESAFAEVAAPDEMANNMQNVATVEAGAFWQLSEELCAAVQPYDVVTLPDGKLRPDTVTAAELGRFRTLVLPDCRHLTEHQCEAIAGFLDGGGRVVGIGRLAENLSADTRGRIAGHPGTTWIDTPAGLVAALPGGPQLEVAGAPGDLAVCVHVAEAGPAVHLVRYAYDEMSDRVPELPQLQLSVRLPAGLELVAVHDPGGSAAAEVDERAPGEYVIRVTSMGVYTVVELAPVSRDRHCS
jgi:hypothetical protein